MIHISPGKTVDEKKDSDKNFRFLSSRVKKKDEQVSLPGGPAVVTVVTVTVVTVWFPHTASVHGVHSDRVSRCKAGGHIGGQIKQFIS